MPATLGYHLMAKYVAEVQVMPAIAKCAVL